jgi:hypothetical protein
VRWTSSQPSCRSYPWGDTMGVEDIIGEKRSIDGMRNPTGVQQPTSQNQGGAQKTARQNAGTSGTIQINLGEVSQFEKTDLMFWMMVVDSIALIYIAWKL